MASSLKSNKNRMKILQEIQKQFSVEDIANSESWESIRTALRACLADSNDG